MYRIQKGASDKFTIGAETGIISVAIGASLDPDLTQPRTTSYSLTVVAIDGGSGDFQQQTSVTVNITVMDVNNKVPVFIDPGTVKIFENSPVSPLITLLNLNHQLSILNYLIQYFIFIEYNLKQYCLYMYIIASLI